MNQKIYKNIPKIEKNIEPPKYQHGTWDVLARKMEQGDSVFIETVKLKSTLRTALYRNGKDYCSKKEKEGYRVWCTGVRKKGNSRGKE